MSLRRVWGLMLVTVVALLVWAFAEAESLRATEVPIEIAFEPGSSGSGRVVDPVDPASPAQEPRALPSPALVHATVQIEAGAGAADAMARRARRGPVRMSPGMEGLPATPGAYSVPLREALRAHPDFRGLGVDIKKVEPEAVRVLVDELVTRQARVQAEVPEGRVEGVPEVRPGVVTLTLPGRYAGALGPEPTATVRLEDRVLAALIPGRRETVPGLRVQPPAGLAGAPHVSIEPPVVEAVVTTAGRQASVRLASVPVHLRIAPAELAKFDVQVPESDRALVDVTVTGPADLVRQIEEKTLPVVAFVPLSFEELERGIASKDAVFAGLPTVLRFDVASRTVRLVITRRAPPPNGPDPG
jgi:hypothetical protein